MPFADAYGVAAGWIGITQKPEEIRWLFGLVREQRPRTVLEIGMDEGGTLFLWTRAAAPDARLIAIDTRPPGPLGLASPFPLVRRSFACARQRVELVMAANSHDPATLERVRAVLGGRKIDFLFVDGDHSYEGVWQDFHMYSPLVRRDGLIAFHDVSQSPTPFTEGAAAFWRDFAADRETDERVVGDEPGFGIGVYRVPE